MLLGLPFEELQELGPDQLLRVGCNQLGRLGWKALLLERLDQFVLVMPKVKYPLKLGGVKLEGIEQEAHLNRLLHVLDVPR